MSSYVVFMVLEFKLYEIFLVSDSNNQTLNTCDHGLIFNFCN